MRILFVHQNFPGQFVHLAPALAADPALDVRALAIGGAESAGNVRIVRYQPQRASCPDIHPWLVDFESKVIRGEAAFRAALALKQSGFYPDVIVAHPGWGESLFLKEVWPDARLGIYCEYHYSAHGADVGFDPEFTPADPAQVCRIALKNLNGTMHADMASAGISPTQWQASSYPEPFRSRISVIHDGIDTERVRPNDAANGALSNGLQLSRGDETITFVNRNLEPYRGYHVFMRLLPELLARRPRAHVLIVGGEGVSYGAAPPPGTTWKQIFLDEVRPNLTPDMLQRIHYLGNLPYNAFLSLLQLSAVHVYLTYPFVLSWSLLEAMSAGCAIVASDTEPLREVIRDDENGRLAGFFDRAALTEAIVELLESGERRAYLGANARRLICERYDLRSVCLPAQIRWVKQLAGRSE